MKVIYIVLFALFLLTEVNAQDKYFTKTGYVSFFSHSLVEDIKADNNQVLCILDIKTGKIQVKVLMRSFQFKKALMQEHFNENYVESDKFPKASFIGEIVDFASLNDNMSTAEVKGILTIHGKDKEIIEKVTIKKTSGEIALSGDLMVQVKDFDIEIPSIASKNIAEKIKVSLELPLKPYK